MLIPGHATAEGTQRFAGRFESRLPGHFRETQGLKLSSIGLGTYLGEPTAAYDSHYREAILGAFGLGTNVVDSAINYRHQRSERAVGQALASALAAGASQRDEIFLSTKGGFLNFDAEEPRDALSYFHEKLIATGLVRPEEVAAGCHVMSPKYLENQIDSSRKNLGVETIDLYYLHNPETQLGEISRQEFSRRLTAAFTALEKAVAERKICAYGAATWNAFRVAPEGREALSIAEVLHAAEEAGGKGHHFRAVQLPFNLAMPEALLAKTQPTGSEFVPFLQAARTQGISVFASASLLQGQLSRGLPAEIQRWFPGLQTDAQRAIQFVRSTPGVTCALVGMNHRQHVEENLATATVERLTPEEFRSVFRK